MLTADRVEDVISLRNCFEVGYIFLYHKVRGIGSSDGQFCTDKKDMTSIEFPLWLAPLLADEAS